MEDKTKTDILRVLKLFNRQHNKLSSSKFIENLKNNPSGASFKWERG
ncbi:MAG: hypothetical protein Q8N99_02850 [Nanoarchaeota archaeon]|nr:hypothetical protein [Nanoarchaeota archaeon]